VDVVGMKTFKPIGKEVASGQTHTPAKVHFSRVHLDPKLTSNGNQSVFRPALLNFGCTTQLGRASPLSTYLLVHRQG